MGRPSKYSPKLAGQICERLSNGETMRSICKLKGMPSFPTIYAWEKKHEDFLALSARAREIGTHALAEECLDISDDLALDPQDKRIRIDTRIRLIGKWNAKRYGDKIEHDVKAAVKVELVRDWVK